MRETDIADVLKHCRQRAGLTQEALARKLYVDRTTVTKIETGDIPQPSYAIVKEWARITSSADLVAMHFAGDDSWKEYSRMKQIFGQIKSLVEPVNFMRRKSRRMRANG